MLKTLKILLLSTLSVVVIAAVGLAVFFDQIEARKEWVERSASRLVGQPVSSEALRSNWHNGNPQLLVKGLRVESIDYDSPDLAVDEVALEVNWTSLFRLWPKVERITVDGLSLRIESLAQGGVKVGGFLIPLLEDRQPPEKLFRWAVDQGGLYVADSEIQWHRAGGTIARYTSVNLAYALDDERRLLQGVLTSTEGDLLLRSEFFGNPFRPASDWHGEFVVAAVGVGASDTSTGFSLSSTSGSGSLRVPEIEITHLRDLLVMVGVLPKFGIWMQQANVTGLLQDLEVKFVGDLLDLDSWNAQASFADVSFEATEQTPAASNLGVRIQATSDGGLVSVDSRNVTLGWPQHFPDALDITQIKAELLWNTAAGKTQLKLTTGSVIAEQGVIDDIDATIVLQAGVAEAVTSMRFNVPDVTVLKGFVPQHLSPRMLEWWEHAFPRGAFRNGQLHYSGPLSVEAIRTGQGKLYGSVDVVGVDVDYGRLRNWPLITQIEGKVVLDQDRLIVTPRAASIYQSEIKAGEVVIESLFERGRVVSVVDAEIAGPAGDVVRFLLEGPLFASENRPDIGIAASTGSYSTRFSVDIPVANVRSATVSGVGVAEDVELVLPTGLIARGFDASVEYTKNSVSGEGVVDDFLGGAASLSLRTLVPGQPPELQLIASGNLVPDYLSPVLGEPLANSLSGETQWQGTMSFGSGLVAMQLESDLAGLVMALPQPVYKGPGEQRPFNAEVEFAGQGFTTVRYDMGEHLRGLLKLRTVDDRVVFDGGDLVYGSQPLFESFPEGGVGIRIQAEEINLDPWLDYIYWVSEQWPGLEDSASGFVSALHRAEISGEKVRLFDKQFGQLSLKGESNDGMHWKFDVNGEAAEGQLEAAPANEAPFYIADFRFLNWPTSEPDVGSRDDDLKPNEYPIISIHADDFRFAGRQLGELNIVARPDGETWNIARMDMIQPALNILATGVWEVIEEGQTQTSFEFRAATSETSEALGALALGDFLDGGGLHVEGNANWPGPPSAVVMRNLEASYKLAANRGRLVGVDPKAGRLLGLLNINSLSRRLRLDFSDIFSSGFTFDNLGSEGIISDGNLALQEFYVAGPSAYVQSQGRIGLTDEDYDLELVVSPQLGGNIALLSALANPAAGAVLYIAQRLFEDHLNDVLRYSYTVTGDWGDPEITSTRIEPAPPAVEREVEITEDLLEVNVGAKTEASVPPNDDE